MDQDEEEEGVSFLGGPTSPSTTPKELRPRSPSSPAALRAPGRCSRRVSLIPGEALESSSASQALTSFLQQQEQQHAHRFPPNLTLPLQDTAKPRVVKSKTTDEGSGGGGHGVGVGDGAATANSSPVRYVMCVEG